MHKVTFVGEAAGEQTAYVYLPKGYSGEAQHYRTLYHLHGAFVRESWAEQECHYIGSKVDEAVAVGIIEPMIVVCPVDPDGNRMWSDSYDGKYLASTALIEDLIPYIDGNYRTVAARNGRILQGFSMGGFGAVTNGYRHADLFQAILIWDGALHDWRTISNGRKSITDKMFGTEAYFEQWSPYTASKNVPEADLDVFMVVGEMGAIRDFASRFKPHLERTGQQFTYHDVACPHSLMCMMDVLAVEAFSFMAECFAKS